MMQIGSVPPNPSGAAPLPPTSALSTHPTGSVLIMTAARPNTPASQSKPATEQSGQRGPVQGSPTASGTSAISASGVQQTTRDTNGAALAVSAPFGRQMDVKIAPAQAAIIVERNARTTK